MQVRWASRVQVWWARRQSRGFHSKVRWARRQRRGFRCMRASGKTRFGMYVTRWRGCSDCEIGDRAHSNGDGALLKGIVQAVAQVACIPMETVPFSRVSCKPSLRLHALQWRRCPSQGYLASRRSGCMHGTMSNHHGRAQRRRSGSARSTRIWPCSPPANGYVGYGCATPRCRLRSNQSHQTPSRHSGQRAAP